MSAFLGFVHEWLGYLVSIVLLVTIFVAYRRAREMREFRPQAFVFVAIALDVQVLLGILRYALDGFWSDRAEIAYIHPVLALAALAVAHVFLRRARSAKMAVDANRLAGRGMLIALLLVIAAIGVASAPPFL